MTDRELLELAAKAAGVEIPEPNPWFIYDGKYGFKWLNMDGSATKKQWNPLNDDGDALRLAVKVGIDLEWRSDGRLAAYRHANANGYCFTAFESSRGDRAAATRRAIVRAAAEVGRNMK